MNCSLRMFFRVFVHLPVLLGRSNVHINAEHSAKGVPLSFDVF